MCGKATCDHINTKALNIPKQSIERLISHDFLFSEKSYAIVNKIFLKTFFWEKRFILLLNMLFA